MKQTLAILSLALFFSCIEGSQGIFFTLEKEELVNDVTNLSNTLTVAGQTIFNGDIYIASIQSKKRSLGANEWSNWNAGSISSGMTRIVDVASNGTDRLYAILTDGSDYELHFSADGSSWAEVTTLPTGAIPYSMAEVFDQNGTAVAFVLNYTTSAEDGYHSAFDAADTDFDTSFANIPAASTPIIQGATDGTDFALVNSSSFYFVAGSTIGNVDLVDKSDSGNFTNSPHNFGGVAYDDALAGGTWLVSTDDGYIFSTDDPSATAFSRVNTDQLLDSGDNVVHFGEIIFWLDPDGSQEVFLVGSNNGYYEVFDSSGLTVQSPERSTSNDSYISKEIAFSTVKNFSVDPSNRIYFGTLSRGLWVAENDSLDVQ
jgi:flagellin-like hook-associated protein FlgL